MKDVCDNRTSITLHEENYVYFEISSTAIVTFKNLAHFAFSISGLNVK